MANSRVVIASPSSIDQSRLAVALGQTGACDVVAQTMDLSATYTRVEELMPDFVLIAESMTTTAEYGCMLALFRAVDTCVLTIQSDAGVPASVPASVPVQNLYHGQIHARMGWPELLQTLHRCAQDLRATHQRPPFAKNLNVAKVQFDPNKILLIGASTGGIDALTTILRHFPENCPPTAIVQHTGRNFSETLARLLDRNCLPEVALAQTGLPMQPGRICLAGGLDRHLTLDLRAQAVCRLVQGPATSGHTPSIDELFLSAVPAAPRIVAALLTGMGRDGATGLLELRKSGAATIGQDQATSVVYGMPRVAHEIGAVRQQLPLNEIGPALLNLCQLRQPQTKMMGRL